MRFFLLVLAAVLLVVLARMCFFTVDPTEYVYVTQFGRHVATYDGQDQEADAGLHLRWPWPVQSVTSRATSTVCVRVRLAPNSLSTTRRMIRLRSAAGFAARAATLTEIPASACSTMSSIVSWIISSKASASSPTRS